MRNRDLEMTPALARHAELWNQLIDANRAMFALWAPWLQVTPWFLNAAAGAPVEKIEQEAVIDGVPDTLELQARQWNHFLDAQRQFWSAFGWPLGGALAVHPVADADEDEEERSAEEPPRPARKVRPRATHH
ncbi:MAG TPA: hypothetical protein VKI18_12575 [Albitalea sp.]|nr:hypothetical protein [Albitalea sp.]